MTSKEERLESSSGGSDGSSVVCNGDEDRLIDGLRKANRQAMCGGEEGCGRRVGRLERRISGKQPPIGGKVRSKNY